MCGKGIIQLFSKDYKTEHDLKIFILRVLKTYFNIHSHLPACNCVGGQVDDIQAEAVVCIGLQIQERVNVLCVVFHQYNCAL